MHYPYDAFLRGTGLTVRFMRLSWYTTAFNRSIVKWTSSCPKLMSFSFNCGVYLSIILLPVSIFLLLFSAMHISDGVQSEKISNNFRNVKVEVLLPGLNLPLDEIGFYIVALSLSSILHELGHAMSAVIEDVPIIGFGFEFWFIIPIAFTELGTEQINSLKMWKKLRVLCAGIWHNILLAIIGYLILYFIPIIFVPFYSTDESVVISHVNIKSPVYGLRGLQPNDIITNINDCKVYNSETWFACLHETISNHPAYCLSTDFVHQNDESIQIIRKNDGVIDCCDSKNLVAACFEYISDYGELEVPEHMCLNIRKTIEHSNRYCHTSRKCDQNLFCITPQMNNATTIIHIKRLDQKDMIYMGHPYDVTSNVKISNFVPKSNLWNPAFADFICTLLKYIVVFSLGLALINVIPCFGLDGQHIISTTINQLFKTRLHKKQREIFSLSVTVFGSILLFLSMIKTLWISLASTLFQK